MTKPRESRTLAADSAPGVGDGPVRETPAPPVNSKPGARKPVFIIVALVVAALIALMLAGRLGGGGGSATLENPTTASQPAGEASEAASSP
ncbi:MAG: hypothetical protein H2041_01150 [Phenylobacterium sp.]|uniref:hypothetical protein n=1 Tax=Phenylobacterium sp. TaxID=1871053 RepID=UPI0008C0EC60|nr:hypothetical protein [Phenylobacterium sp.]MBA4792254.1 hypothetical protein [Phenylobacterium sp.]OHB39469.1 MAG: hypothetical protein A2882_10000 [Phenylobacterium sp. RIFCSPHIGHO2_01_FULL_70_10]